MVPVFSPLQVWLFPFIKEWKATYIHNIKLLKQNTDLDINI